MHLTRYSANREIVEKSPETINRETALKWQSRAMAAYKKYGETALDKWIIEAEQFRDEAIEHAGLGGDFGRMVGKVERKLNDARRKARHKASAVRSKGKHASALRQMPLHEAQHLVRQIAALELQRRAAAAKSSERGHAVTTKFVRRDRAH